MAPKKSWRTAFDFVNARARHDRHDWQRIFHQTIVTASAFRIRLHRNHAGQGMADIRCVNAGALINLLLEGKTKSIWSTARRIWWMRSGRQAQMAGLTKCTVGIPRRRSFCSMPRLKSGASTPTKHGA